MRAFRTCGAGSRHRRRSRRLARVAASVALGVACVVPGTAFGDSALRHGPESAIQTHAAKRWFDGHAAPGSEIPAHYVGLSIEWSLVERYMGTNARPTFVNLLRNLETGVLRIGGSSQDLMEFDPTAPNTNRVITREDLADIRATLRQASAGRDKSWAVVLGTAMAPPGENRPFVSPEHARRFVREGVAHVFRGHDSRLIAGIELGNEPDLSYRGDLAGYLADLSQYAAPEITGPYPIITPNTSEDILPWQSIHERTVPTRWFWDWPQILEAAAPEARRRAGPFGAYASDHFYPLARTCVNRPYRCPSVEALLSDEHIASLHYQTYVHAQEAAKHGLGYRLEETNTAAGRGADGVSNVAASATYALDALFTTACPQPPHLPNANADCRTGAVGVNFHNAEVRAFWSPEEGNAYYNAINYDPSPAMSAPTARPVYYAMLLFAAYAQDTRGLRPVSVSDPTTGVVSASQMVKAWRVLARSGKPRLFLINKGDQQATVDVAVPAARASVSRMTPYDPSGAGRTLDAPKVRIDGRQVAGDGTWLGFHPTTVPIRGGRLQVDLAPGEAVVISIRS